MISSVLVIYALMSWFPGARESKLGRIIENLVEPILSPFQRLNLQFSGLDFTVIAALFALQCLERLLIYLLL